MLYVHAVLYGMFFMDFCKQSSKLENVPDSIDITVEASRLHLNTPHSLGLVWKSDRHLVANYLT
jgi:hypothetical protein